MKFILNVFCILQIALCQAQVWQYESVPPMYHLPGFSSALHFSFATEADGSLWATNAHSMARKQSGVWQAVPYPDSVYVRYFTNDASGTLWLFSDEKLYRHGPGGWDLEMTLPIFHYPILDTDGNLWMLKEVSASSTQYWLQRLSAPATAPVMLQGSPMSVAVNLQVELHEDTLHVLNDLTLHRFLTDGTPLSSFEVGDYWDDFAIVVDGQMNITESGRLLFVPSSDCCAYVDTIWEFTQDSVLKTALPWPCYIFSRHPVIGETLYYPTGGPGSPAVAAYDAQTGNTVLHPIDHVTPYAPNQYRLTANNGILYAFDADFPYSSDLFYLAFDPNAANAISGKVFLDANGNGIADTGETPLVNQLVILTPTGYITATATDGTYSFALPDTAGSYSVSLTSPGIGWLFSTPSTHNVTQTNAGEMNDGIDFGLIPAGAVDDVSVAVWSTPARPGMNTAHIVQLQNHGTQTHNGQVTVSLDSLFVFNPIAGDVPATVNGNDLTFDINGLNPFGTTTVLAIGLLDQLAVAGDSVTTTASAPVPLDVAPDNNVAVYRRMITSSYDPNIKEVTPAGLGLNAATPPGTRLSYTIHFQNTGTDTAFTVVIRDLLDHNLLDLSTFTLVASSHPMQLEMSGYGNAAFVFNDILLPDSTTNEPLSHGFVRYDVNVKQNAPLGSLLYNTALIYFDFNEPIVTNTTSNLIDYPTSVPIIRDASTLIVSPNPANKILLLHEKDIFGVTALNVLGQQMPLEGPLSNKINIQSWPAGLYLIKVDTKQGIKQARFVKQ